MRLRRLLLTLTLTGAFLPMLTLTNEAVAGPNGPCSGQRYYVTQRLGPLIREARVKNLIRCVFTYYGIGSQIPTAMYVANRESHFNPYAWNRWSDCRGVYQMLGRYWQGRVNSLLPPQFFPRWPNVSAFWARANVFVTARMVRASGWGPWSL